MSKVIKSSVSVPENLYVYREADAQLRNVIDGMSRPGYISVARQMGKTSLLQHTKKQLQNRERIIIYFDLSASVYSSAKQYFRYIIDTIIEVEDDSLNKVGRIIRERRRDTDTDTDYSASGEHDKELRLLLNALPGTLVIILDEVDALAKAEFSDEIFAQIRSVYFMRNTHEALHNITYVLSGVIEPAKLIKNKDNSPFNIATQIFLDDFSFEEYYFFIEKSKLEISINAIERIYDWTCGNPRMTYEVCSAIEDIVLKNEQVDTSTVDKVVHELYLTQYNKAPIDHIRDIVLNNAVIRNAVRSLKKNSKLSDEIIGQLYLYGIIESKFKSKTPKIKNKIIEEALSDSWLNEVDRQEKGLYDLGLERINLGDLDEGIGYLLQYVEASELNDLQQSTTFFSIANAYHKLGDYAKSNEYLDLSNINKEGNPDDYYLSLFIKSLNYFSQNQPNTAFPILKEVVDNGVKNQTYYTALINYGYFKLIQDFDENHELAIGILIDADRQVANSGLPKHYKDSVIASSNFRLAVISERLEKKDDAYSYYKRAMSHADLDMKPTLLIGLIATCPANQQISYAKELHEIITNPLLSFLPKTGSDADFTQRSLFQAVGLLYEFYSNDFMSLINYCSKHYYNEQKEDYSLLYDIGSEMLRDNNKDAKAIFHLGLKCSNISELYKGKCHVGLALCIIDNSQEFATQALRALNFLDPLNYGLINRDDIIFMVRGAVTYRDSDNYILALRFINYLTNRLDADDEKLLPGDCIVIYYLAANIYGLTEDFSKEYMFYDRALKLVPLWRTNENQILVLLPPKAVNSVIQDIEKLINNRVIQGAAAMANLIQYNELPRNSIITVRYRDGRIMTGKAKKFDQDLKAGNCRVL